MISYYIFKRLKSNIIQKKKLICEFYYNLHILPTHVVVVGGQY